MNHDERWVYVMYATLASPFLGDSIPGAGIQVGPASGIEHEQSQNLPNSLTLVQNFTFPRAIVNTAVGGMA